MTMYQYQDLTFWKYSPLLHLQIIVGSKALTVFPHDFSLNTFLSVKEPLTNDILDNQWYRKFIPYNEIHITSTSEEKYKITKQTIKKKWQPQHQKL